jgi:hypothetical protein
MRDLHSKVAADGFKWLFSHLLILSIVFHIFLKSVTSNEKYMLKYESIYPFRTFKGNPPI